MAMAHEADLVELPATQAFKAYFPPGCCVWVHSNESMPSTSTFDRSTVSTPQHWDNTVYEGKVQSVYLGDVFSFTRKFYYKVEAAGGQEVVNETNMTFARNAPVFFLGDRPSDDCSTAEKGTATQKGEILTSMCYADNDADKIEVVYSLMLLSKDDKIRLKHGVRPRQLRFRPDALVGTVPGQGKFHSAESQSTLLGFAQIGENESYLDGRVVARPNCLVDTAPSQESLAGSDQSDSSIDAKSKPPPETSFVKATSWPNNYPSNPPPGFAQMTEKESSEDGSFVVVAAKNKHKHYNKETKLQIPHWLVADGPSRNDVIGE